MNYDRVPVKSDTPKNCPDAKKKLAGKSMRPIEQTDYKKKLEVQLLKQ